MLIAFGAACASAGSAGGAVRSRAFGADDRLVVRRTVDVIGVAASARAVYALTTRGLITYDRIFARWRAPSSRVDEDLQLAGLSDVRNAVLAADPIEDALWIGIPGAVVLLRPQSEQVQRITVSGQPDVIGFPRGGSDAVVRASGRWLRVSRAGFVTSLDEDISNISLVLPVQLEEVYRQHPSLRGQLTFLLRDNSAASGRASFSTVTSGTLSPDQPSEAWIGTRGAGLWRVDASFMRAEQLRYGLLDDMIGALGSDASGVWSAGLGAVRGGGLSYASRDLQSFMWLTGDVAQSFDGVRATALAVRGDNIWIGTTGGVIRARVGRDVAYTQWGQLHGLPGERVAALVPRDGGAWIATDRGLAFVPDTASAASQRSSAELIAFAGRAVRALVIIRDTLVIGVDDGLYVMSSRSRQDVAGNAAPQRVAGDLVTITRPVRSLSWSDSVLLVVTDQGAHVIPVARVLGAGNNESLTRTDVGRLVVTAASDTGIALSSAQRKSSVTEAFATPVTAADLRALGGVVAASIDTRSVWIAGPRGVLAFERGATAMRVVNAGSELPGEVTSIALDPEWAWIGTVNGLVRVRRSREGALP